MATYGEIVSEILNDLKLLNMDEHVSRRYIISKLRSKTKNLISQKLLDRTLGSEQNLYKEVRCFELEMIDVVECDIVEFRTCNKLMKSKKPLPESVYSRLGMAIKEVTSIDGMFEFQPIDPKQYRRNQKRAVKDNNTCNFYVDGENYLYLPNSEVEVVNVRLLTLKPEDIEELEGCDRTKSCQSIWDMEFIVPDKLQQAVYKDTLNELAGVNRRIQPDANPDNNEYSRT